MSGNDKDSGPNDKPTSTDGESENPKVKPAAPADWDGFKGEPDYAP